MDVIQFNRDLVEEISEVDKAQKVEINNGTDEANSCWQLPDGRVVDDKLWQESRLFRGKRKFERTKTLDIAEAKRIVEVVEQQSTFMTMSSLYRTVEDEMIDPRLYQKASRVITQNAREAAEQAALEARGHRTMLLGIANEVIDKFWKDFNPAIDNRPTKEAVITWLKENYPKISKNEMEAVDLVTRPDNYRKTNLLL